MDTVAEVETYTCDGCETKIDREYDWYDFGIDDKVYCDACHSDDINSASTVMFFEPDEEPVKVLVGSAFIVDAEYYETWNGTKIGSQWVSTDGWRGYNNTSIEGYVEILTGWTTGWADEYTSRKNHLNEWIEKVLPTCPIPVALTIERTSNVFSLGIAISVPEGREEEFTKKWLSKEEFQAVHDWLS